MHHPAWLWAFLVSCLGFQNSIIFTYIHCILLCRYLYALRALSPLPCTYIHSVAFNSMHGFLPLPCTYIHHILLCGFNSLCGWHFYTKDTIPTTMYLHSLYFTAWISIHHKDPHHLYLLCVPVCTQFPMWVTFLHLQVVPTTCQCIL